MSGRQGRIVALIAGVGLAAGFVWSQRPHPPAPAASSGVEPMPVRLVEVREQPVAIFVEAVGTLRSREQVVIASRLAAEVRSVLVTAGSSVATGDLLLELEATDLEAHVASAAAGARAAEQTHAEAQREEQRTRTLFEREARTQQELDTAVTRLAGATAERAAAQGMLAASRAALGDARLLAPFDGVVFQRSVDAGDLATPGRPLLELYDPRALRLEVALAERLVAGIAVGDEFAVVLESLADSSGAPLVIQGRVDEIVPAIDAATRTAVVKLALPEIAGALPGMFGRAGVPAGVRVALVVPRAAIVERGQLELVFTPDADGRQARMHLVRTGRPVAGGGVEILAGLSGAQEVILEGAERLRDGTPIRVESASPGSR